MAVPLSPTLRTGIWVVAIPLGLYFTFLVLGATPFFQRHFLYAHKVNTLFWVDVNKPQYWGFAKNQVTPFSLETPDGVTLYAWHILPLPVYLPNEDKLSAQKTGFSKDFTATESFRMLKNDPEAKLVISFHGNAGHIAQGWRPGTYHALTETSPYHVLAVDYRGFGHSTGSPTEEGLIQDGVTLVEFAMKEAGISPSRIVILGQSLGTAVASGVAEHFISEGVEFSGVVLVAGFSSLSHLLVDYRISGYVPVLSPIKVWPGLVRWFQSFIVDKWPSAERLASLVRQTKTRLRLSLVHAKNDWDIPCHESDKLFRAAANATVPGGLDDHAFEAWKDVRTVKKDDTSFITTWTAEPNIIIRQELFPYGGHNDIMGYAPVALAIMRSFQQ